MAGSIRGITIEINGDTTGLNNALKDVNSSVRGTQSELKTLNRDLKFNPDSFTLASQKADVLTKTVDSLKNKLGTLRDAQSQVDRQFKDGKIGADQYRAFQREVVETNSKLRNYQEQLKSVQSTTSGLNGAVNRIKDSFSQLKNASSGGNELSSSFKRVRASADEAGKSSRNLGDIIKGSFVGTTLSNAVTSLASTVKNAFKEMAGAGFEYDVAQQKMQATWLTLTGSDGAASAMVKTINDLSVKTGQSTDTVNELEQGFYHLHSSKKESDDLTASMLNMADAVGLNSDQIQAVTQDMVNGLSRGKANAGMLNQISQYFPMFRENLAKYENQIHHSSNITTADLTTMAKQGKISATDIENVFNQLGSGKYDKAASNMMSTMYGMERTIKARIPALLGDAEQPILTAKNPLYSAISKWVSDKNTDNEFKKLGKTIGTATTTITQAFSKIFGQKSFADQANGIFDSLSRAITNAANMVASHAQTIVNFFKGLSSTISIFKSIGSGVFSGIISGLKLLLAPFSMFGSAKKNSQGLANALGSIASHKNALQELGRLLVLYFVTSKIFSWINSLAKGFTALRVGLMATSNADKAAAIQQRALNLAMKANIIIAVVSAIAALVGALIWFFTQTKTGRKIWSDFINWLKNAWNGIKNFFVNLWNGIAKFFSNTWNSIKTIGSSAWNWISSVMGGVFRGIGGTFRSIWNGISGFFGGIWGALKSIASGGWNWISGGIRGFLNGVSGVWHSMWQGISDFFGGIWQGIKNTVRDAMNGVIDIINGGIGAIDDVIHAFGGKKHTISLLTHIRRFADGTDGAPKGLAMVNDGGGQEAIIDNQNNIHVLKGANQLVDFEGGEQVIPYQASKEMFGNSINHFAGGTFGWIAGIGNWIKDKWDSIVKFISNPLSALNGIISPFLDRANGASELVSGLADSLGHGLIDGIAEPFKELLQSFKKKHDSEDSANNPGGAGVDRWKDTIKKAADKMNVHLTTAGMNAILHRINQESGGDPNITNNWDSNAAKGTPSKGLLQYIQPTLSYWVPKGISANLSSGYAQLVAMFNDSNWLADISVPGGWGPSGTKRFAHGAVFTKPTMFASNTGMNIIGDTPNADEAALPLTPSVLAQIGRGIAEASGIGNPNISVNVYPTNDMTEDGINKMSSKIVDAIQKNLFLRNKISNTVGTTLAKGVN